MTEPTTTLAEQLSGAYRVERPLGEGGMASVWLAQDLKHQRPVALKVLKPELAHELGPERFRREIATAARLQHPHILSVFDSGETTAGQLWFTMPYVAGETLRARLKRERCLSVDEALRITREAAQGLQHAHTQGIVHRDIKPENLLLTEDGSTLVADFGIARALGSDGTATTTGEQLTETGTSIGTPMYMAPEQCTGEKVIDARADQYALAATLFEMLTGAPPFTGETAGAIIAKRFSAPVPSVRTQRPEVPVAVEEALRRALALRPEERFPTIRDFARALEQSVATPASSSGPALPATVVTPAATPALVGPWRRLPLLLAGAGLVVLVGAGALLLRRTPAPTAGAVRLAVLPFENLGDSADAYFAEGLSDELRGKLTGVPSLEVIARTSSVPYRGSSKPPQEIARELDVRYLLTGTVRWDKAGDGTGRVRVSPELIEVVPGKAPASRWQQPFDAPLTDVFQVQSGIATEVAGALGVALGAGTQQQLEARPTQDFAAYDAFLRAEAAWQDGADQSAPALARAAPLFQEAVRRDSTFGLAWARLAWLRAGQYANDAPTPAWAAEARTALARAQRLAPDHPATVRASYMVASRLDRDLPRARALLEAGLAKTPNQPTLLRMLGQAEFAAGDLAAARRALERAAQLDPRAHGASAQLALVALYQHDLDAARAAAERAYALRPTPSLLQPRVRVELAAGDLARAQALVQEGISRLGREAVTTEVALYGDLYWVLRPEDQAYVLGLEPEAGAFGGVRSNWALTLAQLHHLRGDTVRARVFADTARREIERELQEAPDEASRHAYRGVALALLGQREAALAAVERGVALAARGSWSEVLYIKHQLVRIHLLTGDRDRALDGLDALLQERYDLTSAWLRLDPDFIPLRGHPRFEQLLTGR